MVYNKFLKKLARNVYKTRVHELVDGWATYKQVVISTLPGHSTKVQNWVTHLLMRQNRRKVTSTFDLYAAKILNRKSMFKKLAKIPTQISNDVPVET